MRASGDNGEEGLGAFASESEPQATAAPPRSLARHALEQPRLVPLLVVVAVVAYGGLIVLWWERDTPEVKPSYSAAPTTSFRPTVARPSPEPEAPSAGAPPRPAEALGEVPDDFFVPVAARPEPIPAPAADTAEDAVVSPLPAVPDPAPAPEAVVTAAPVAPPPVVAIADPAVTARVAIGDVLQSYRTAYNALDATSVSTIWQGLDTRALQRAFSTLSQQDVQFDRCEVRVTTPDRAVASCRGVLSYVPRIWDGTPQQRQLSWNFDFLRAADRWLIAAVSAR